MRHLNILNESFHSAIKTISVNKLRTFLSLLGVTIGIFAIISVFTVLDSMESEVRKSLESLGDDVIYIQKWPWAPEDGKEYTWWKYLNRPLPSYKEHIEIKRRVQKAKAVTFFAASSRTIKYKNNSAENIEIWGVSEDFNINRTVDIDKGRYFTPFEINAGKNFALIGNEVASKLFENEDGLAKNIKIHRSKTSIIGILTREGKSMLGGGSLDNVIIIPVKFLGTIVDLRNERNNPMIWVKANVGVTAAELKEELRGAMRSIRRLKPSTDDNFALNQTSILTSGVNQIFKIINIAGALIALFSILVGGFGIANIMFVSVKERTHIIGIQKALGAKKRYILLEVLYESGLLSLTGGVLGLLLIFIATLIISSTADFNIQLTLNNIIKGLLISAVIGFISGFAPARSAARLNPVDAISSTF